MDQADKSAFRETALELVYSGSVTRINEEEKLYQKSISNSEISDILTDEIARLSVAFEKLGHEPITPNEKASLFHKLAQRAVEVGKKSVVLEGNESAKPWLMSADISWSRWKTYEALLLAEGKSRAVIDEHRLVIDRALDLAGDPHLGPRKVRKGLIMGNVQSGKTLNFIGLINKALDVGYHSIIVLGGHMIELRRQAQKRIDDGVINLSDLVESLESIDTKVHSLTDIENDFNAVTLRGKMNLASAPGVYVIKKNVSILKSVLAEIKSSADKDVLSKPMLLIDDEADYASINTKFDADEYSATNKRIRELLEGFETATYVGYTATPFANVFIPFKQTLSGEFDDDLFPSDFMIRMPTPKNYQGQDFFFPEDGELDAGPCRRLDYRQLDAWLPLKHKKDHEVNGLMPQLTEAMHHFVLSIAVRYLRGQTNAHNTMLVNVSRFNDVQKDVASELLDSLNNLINECRSYGGLGTREALLQSPRLKALHAAYQKDFAVANGQFSFDQVLKVLHVEIVKHGIEVELVNGLVKKRKGASGSLSYESHKELGYWVIAVGGLKLSRGLTLEGLTTSFFARNAMAYDTLTQMCRWFGYRDGYEDLPRLYLLRESWEHYCEVSNSIRQLDDELQTMRLVGGTPAQFGLRVQTSDTALMITAKNKLGTARSIDFTYRLWSADEKALRSKDDPSFTTGVKDKTFDFIDSLNRRCGPPTPLLNSSRAYHDVKYEELAKFINEVGIPMSGRQRRSEPLVTALLAMSRAGCDLPKVMIFSRAGSRPPAKNLRATRLSNGEAPPANLLVDLPDGDQLVGITKTMSEKSGEIFVPSVLVGDSDDLKLLYPSAVSNSSARNEYLTSPVLVIYFYRALLKNKGEAESGYRVSAEEQPINVGYIIHFPASETIGVSIPEMQTNQKYFVNEVFQEDMFDWDDATDEE